MLLRSISSSSEPRSGSPVGFPPEPPANRLGQPTCHTFCMVPRQDSQQKMQVVYRPEGKPA